MSQRRSARVQAQPHAIAAKAPGGHTAAVAAPAKKRERKAKAAADAATTAISYDASSNDAANGFVPRMPPPPTTPNKRRKVASSLSKPPPMTPTPSAIGFMTSNSVLRPTYSTGDIDDATPPPPPDRPAQPNQTNATLITPRGTQVPPSSSVFDGSPSIPMQETTTTTKCLLDEAVAHLLRVDPTLKPVVDKNHCRVFSPAGLAETIDPFRSLTSGIIAQQVSGAAAKSIKNKFIGLFPPESCPTAFLLQISKAEYIQGLAQKFTSGELTIPLLMNGTDEEVMKSLVAVRGLGAWSVEMFMCFGLKRMDVFSTGDLGVQRGMAAHAGKDVAKLKAKGGGKWKYMAEKEMVERAEVYRPYRSLYMWYMWRVEDVDVEAVGG
ncbi:3-methyladenine DNA glycosylase [Friedmanniomyces endolithicus]|nr:3-methyladenine DNA glycosylase [Friedmanniomyces endolithicus]